MNIQLIKNYFKNTKLLQQKAIQNFFIQYPNIKEKLDNILKSEPNWINYINIINAIRFNLNLNSCKICGKTLKFNSKQTYCSLQCANIDKDKINKQIKTYQKTCLIKYGVDNLSKNKPIQEKIQQTNLIKYGVNNPAKSKTIQEKIKQTNLIKYGTKNPQQNQSVKEKTKQTNIHKYGFSNPALNMSWNNILSWKDWIIPMFSKEEFIGYTNNQIYSWKCTKCGNIFQQNIHSTFHKPEIDECLPRCLNCFPYSNGRSNLEDDLINFCKQYIDIERHNNKLIKPFNLDIYIPKLKLAIEFNGCYWHDIEHKPSGYHLMKTTMCENLGIRLIHIWEDEWLNNQVQIKQKLINIFNNNETIDITQRLNRDWFMLKEIPGYIINIEKPEIIKRNNYLCENCGYFYYIKQN